MCVYEVRHRWPGNIGPKAYWNEGIKSAAARQVADSSAAYQQFSDKQEFGSGNRDK